jgi:hypothetical protein
MQVVFLIPGKMMVLNGGLGPLMTLGTTGAMTIQLTGNAGGTKLDAAVHSAENLHRAGPEGLKPSKQP